MNLRTHRFFIQRRKSPVTQSRISFGIPVQNGEKCIEQYFQHIFKEKHPEDEIVVVDNRSIDNMLEIVSRYSVTKVMQFSKVTISALRNHGSGAASGDALAFIDIAQKAIRHG